MVKYLRDNKKVVLAGLTILSMLTFVVQRGASNSGNAADRKLGTINGKAVFNSEFVEARAEMSALIHYVSFTGEERDPKVQLMHALIVQMAGKPELFPLLRHEAIADGVQVSDDDINGVIATYTKETDPDSDSYIATRAGITDLLKIMARYQQIASAVKISKPLADLALVGEGESLQMDLIQFQAADFVDKVPPPTTQQLQDQFTKFADQAPHHPVPTTNPFGFGYRLPIRAKLQYIYVSPDAVNATIVATKSPYDWEVQARKYFLAHPEEFIAALPTSSPTTNATTQPVGPQPFAAVHDKILADIRKPLATTLMDQIQGYLSSTLNSDWQLYSQAAAAPTPGPEPVSSLGVPYTSFDYLNKLVEKVQTRFKVTITAAQTPGDLSQDQIAALPSIGTTTVAEDANDQATNYLDLIDKKNTTAAAQLTRPSPPLQGADINSTVFFRLTEVLPSQPAPDLATVLPQVTADLRTTAAYQLALNAAKALVANASNLPLPIVSISKNALIHLDKLTMNDRDFPQIKPELADSAPSFIKQAFQLLVAYDPKKNHNPAETIELPEQARVFASQLSFVDARWNADNFFYLTLDVRDNVLQMQQQLLRNQWFDFDAVVKRLDYKPNSKNNGG
jgi:hypothetical protein